MQNELNDTADMEKDPNDLSEIEKDLKDLEAIPQYLRENPGDPKNSIFEIKSIDALYLSTKIQAKINEDLIAVMKDVKKVVKASDKKTFRIYIFTILAVAVAAITLVYIDHDAGKNDEYKNEMKKLTTNIENAVRELDSIVLSKNLPSPKEIPKDTTANKLIEVKKL